MASPLGKAFRHLFDRKLKRERAFFDDAYYRRSYPDVVAARLDPFAHFIVHGWREGRNPSPTFNTLFYRDIHLDGDAIDPLAHWFAQGGPTSGLNTAASSPAAFYVLQGSVVARHFDAAFYQRQGAEATGDPIAHYLAEGWKAGFSPSPAFDPVRYTRENAFVASLGVSPFYHWCSQLRLRRDAAEAPPTAPSSNSAAELRRVIGLEFDRAFYLSRFADVRAAKLDPLEHYLADGWREGRDPHPLFDSAYYLRRQPDAETIGNPYHHYLTIGRAEGRRPNPVGTRPHPRMRAPADWIAATPAADSANAVWIVVIPVYRGYDETLAAVYAVLSAPQTTRYALHLVNDRSPDVELTAELERLAAEGLFSYESNPVNLGFVRTCNRALRAFADRQIVLLNADALVFGNWLDRIAEHVRRDPAIATITPYSNNATICSYPVDCANNAIELEVDGPTLDRLASEANSGRVSHLATGVGFCFFMSREARAQIGIFDEEAFGRGYGEENDFCLRAANAGFRNVLAEDIFAYHRGEVSFADIAAEEYGPGQEALHAKHPDYLARIVQHQRADPGRRGRMRFDLRRLARFATPRTIVFVSHALIGGIVTHIRHLETRLRAEGIAVVHLRVGVGDRWSIEVASTDESAPFLPNLRPMALHQMGDMLADFFGWLSPMAIHVHSLVDFDWVTATSLMQFVRGMGLPYFFTLHDYSVMCHRNDLVLTDGRYCGLPAVEVCRLCVDQDRSYPEALDPAVRRQTYDAFLRDATAVFAPSTDIAERVQRAGARFAVTVRPHEEAPLAAAESQDIPVSALTEVVVVGAIGAPKGSRVLLGLAHDALRRQLPIRFHIVGYSDVTEQLESVGVAETGRFRDDAEAAKRVTAIGPACIFLPSIWPETFCYTLTLAFRLGIPPVVFDVGAQAERVRQGGFGFVIPRAEIDMPSDLNDRLLGLPYVSRQAQPEHTAARYSTILGDYYGLAEQAAYGLDAGRRLGSRARIG